MSKQLGIKVGDQVRFVYGEGPVLGIVKEDRGPIGHKGRRLYLVQFSLESPYVTQTEMPAEEFEVIRDVVSTNEKS